MRHSRDEGETWDAPILATPEEGYFVVNDDRRGVPYSPDRSNAFHHRTPLAAAVSDDGGRTWHDCGVVEGDRSRSYCYASIAFHGEDTLLTYYVGVAGGPNLLDMKLAIVPTAAWSE